MTYAKLKDSIVSFNIYYETLGYEKITEESTVSFSTLLSNIGAQIGLFLGISILSFLEIFELFVEMLLNFYRKFKNNKILLPL